MITKDPQELLRYYGSRTGWPAWRKRRALPAKARSRKNSRWRARSWLATAMTERYFNDHPVSSADEEQYYGRHRDEFTRARVKGACRPANAPAPSPDADFDALAAKYPIHEFCGVIGKADAKVPEAVRTAVFALKPGAVTQPIALPYGVYLFRLEGIDVQALDQVRGQISQRLANERFLAWMADIRKWVTVESAPRQ